MALERLEILITAEEKELLEEAAAVTRLTLITFITSSAREAAAAVLSGQHARSYYSRETLAQALLNPEAPNEHLRALAKGPSFRER